MYKCLDCKNIFDVPSKVCDTHGLDTPPYEKYDACPECAGAFEETSECDLCGFEFGKSELGEGICEKCAVELAYELENKIDKTLMPIYLQKIQSIIGYNIENIADDTKAYFARKGA